MKSIIKTIFASALILMLLTGCGGAAPAPETTAPTEMPVVTEFTPPETTVPVEAEAPAETEAPAEETAPYEFTITPVITEAQNPVIVTTADEFLAAIAPNTEIIVDTELIEWTDATGYGKQNGEYYFWQETFDGPELVIQDVANLTIRGAGEDHTQNTLSALPRYAYVLIFENCANIHVTDFTAGHTKEPGRCAGGVIAFRNCQDVLVEDCGLFGCGTIGVQGESSKNMQIVNNDIYECSIAGLEFVNCDDVNVDGNTIRDIGTDEYPGQDFRVYSCGVITCNGQPVDDFSPREFGAFS